MVVWQLIWLLPVCFLPPLTRSSFIFHSFFSLNHPLGGDGELDWALPVGLPKAIDFRFVLFADNDINLLKLIHSSDLHLVVIPSKLVHFRLDF